MNMISLFLYN